MPNLKGEATQLFVPTPEQRETVIYLKAAQVKEEYIRRLIINPKTGLQVSKVVFASAFSEELKTAKAQLHHKALSTLFKGLESSNYEERYRSATKILQLCSKGLYEPKFKFNAERAPSEQINQVMHALRKGEINKFDAEAFIKAIEAKIKAESELSGKEGISIVIDSDTAQQLNKSFIP